MIEAQIQALEKWKLEDEIQKMHFSRNWLTRFKQRFHIKYKLIQGSKVFIRKGDILLEQKRLLTGKMSKYPLSQRFKIELGPETQDVKIIEVSASKTNFKCQ